MRALPTPWHCWYAADVADVADGAAANITDDAAADLAAALAEEADGKIADDTPVAATNRPRLTYFPLHGRAEPIRMLLYKVGVDFEDKTIPGQEWKAAKERGEYEGV